MKLSENGARILKNFEGVRLEAYKCSAGVPTIGVGHTGTVDGQPIHMGMSITKEKADELFNEDIKKFENYVNKINLKLNQNQFDALVSFTFNLGFGCLYTLVRNRNLQQIADALLKYNKAGGKVVDGLVKRRKKERELFLAPVKQNNKENKKESLPYQVKTKCRLNIRKEPSTQATIIRTVEKDTILKVWAIATVEGHKWGKNGKEWYCLDYCERI